MLDKSYYLYNLNIDPLEATEVSSKYPEQVEVLKNRLEKWKQDVNYEMQRPNPIYKGQ